MKNLRDEGCKMYKSHLLVDFWTSSVSCRMTAISGFRLSKHKEVYAFFSLSKSAVMNAVFFLFLESGSISSIPVFLLTNDNSGRHPKSSFRLHWDGGSALENKDDLVKILISYNIEINTREWETKLYLIPSLQDKVSISYN